MPNLGVTLAVHGWQIKQALGSVVSGTATSKFGHLSSDSEAICVLHSRFVGSAPRLSQLGVQHVAGRKPPRYAVAVFLLDLLRS